MARTLWIFGLLMGFLEAIIFLLFPLDTWPDLLGMALHSLPGLLVLATAILGIWFRKTAGVIMFLEGAALAGLWLTRMPQVSWPAYLLMPGGMMLGGLFLFLGGVGWARRA